jgi:predicted HicB family RNase H-like nuclease
MKDKKIMVRVTEKMQSELDKIATNKGISVPELLRRLAEKEIDKNV